MYENIEINRRNTIPLYQQVKEQIKYSILLGQLKSGEKLPPIRVLASHLHLNPRIRSAMPMTNWSEKGWLCRAKEAEHL